MKDIISINIQSEPEDIVMDKKETHKGIQYEMIETGCNVLPVICESFCVECNHDSDDDLKMIQSKQACLVGYRM